MFGPQLNCETSLGMACNVELFDLKGSALSIHIFIILSFIYPAANVPLWALDGRGAKDDLYFLLGRVRHSSG